MNYWHIQMSQGLVDGDDKSAEEVIEILSEYAIIGTGEWTDKRNNQCRTFKEIMSIGDIVLVRAGANPLALVVVTSDNIVNDIYENSRNIKVLSYYADISKSIGSYSGCQTRGTLEKVSNRNTPTANFIINWHNKLLKNMKTQKIVEILKQKKQIIIQGAPGTGKTYTTASIALSILGIDYDLMNHSEIMQKYKEQVNNKRISFTTFHQSMDYEDFVEGLKPEVLEGGIIYKVEEGIFKKICIKASSNLSVENEINFDKKIDNLIQECIEKQNKNQFAEFKTRRGASFYLKFDETKPDYFWAQPFKSERKDPWYQVSIDNMKKYFTNEETTIYNDSYLIPIVKHLSIDPKLKISQQVQNHVLIIDEINRGNISKIFGELITLLESDKRSEGEHPLKVILPYSKELFEIPSNLYIIGTMNTTDRSVGHIDYAVRRRFAFYTLVSNKEAISSFYDNSNITEKDVLKDKSLILFDKINDYIKANKSPELDLEDLMIGHSYFMAKSMDELILKLEYEVIPLIKEYEKDGIISLKETERILLGHDWKIILN